MSRVENEPVLPHARDFYLLDGYDSPEQAARVQTEKARTHLSLELLQSVIAVASRIDGFNSRQLDQALKRYFLLQARDLDDLSDEAEDDPEIAPAEPVDRDRFQIAT